MVADLRLILWILGAGVVTYFIFRMIITARYKKNAMAEQNRLRTESILLEDEENEEDNEFQVIKKTIRQEQNIEIAIETAEESVAQRQVQDQEHEQEQEIKCADPLLSGYVDIQETKSSKEIKQKAVPVAPVEAGPCEERVMIEDVISICILPRNRRAFTGRSILTTLKTMNFIFTDKHVFQRFQEPDLKSPLFTVVSMVEPGTFNIHTLGAELVPGLVLFLTLPHPKGALSSFESMLSNARQLASILGGDLCDSKRNHLTGQTIVHYRERVQEHLRKQLAKARVTDNA